MFNWKKNGPIYELHHDGAVAATMKIDCSKADCTIGKRSFQLRHRGFWRSVIELTDHNGHVVLRVEPVTWYGSTLRFSWQHRSYELVLRNNPLAEYAIRHNGKDVLAYGLKTGSEQALSSMAVSLTMPGENHYEFHLLLWFLTYAFAEESGGGEMSTLMLTMGQ